MFDLFLVYSPNLRMPERDVCATWKCTVDDGQRRHFVACQASAAERAAQGFPKNILKGAQGEDVRDARGLKLNK